MAPPILKAATLALRALKLCPVKDPCPKNNLCISEHSYKPFEVQCNTEFMGRSFKNIETKTIFECINACALTDTCIAVSFANKACHLKAVVKDESSHYNVNMTSAILYEQEKPPSEFVPLDHVPDALVCPEKWGCPKNNGCKKHKNETSAFVLRCGWDFPGGDYVHFHAKDLHSCGQACVEDDRCLAATFTGNIKSGLCYLKDNIYPVNKLALVDTFYRENQVQSLPANASKTVPLPTPDQNPASPVPTQLLLNPGFERGVEYVPAAWSWYGQHVQPALTGRSERNPHSGSYSFQVFGARYGNAWEMGVSQNLQVVPGKSYTVQYYVKQALPGNCAVDAIFNNVVLEMSVRKFQDVYMLGKGIIPAYATMRRVGTFTISLNCKVGGALAGLWLDDVSVTPI